MPNDDAPRDDAPPTDGTAASHRFWWPAALALVAVGWGAQQFTPLLLLYRQQFGLSSNEVQLAFAAYTFALIPGLLIGGPVSDRLGRFPVVAFGVLCSLAAGGVMLSAGAFPVGLLALGRALQGLAAGAAFSSGAAWLAELSAITGNAAAAPRRSTIAMTTGFALGPLLSGLIAQWAPWPHIVAYLPHLVLCLLALVALARLPPALKRRTSGGRGPGQLISPHLAHRRFLLVVVPLAPWVFASCSVAFGYLPGLIMNQLGSWMLAYAALLTAVVGAAGVFVQPLPRRLPARGKLGTGLGLVILGLVLAAGAAGAGSPALTVVAAVVLGAGYGCCQVAGLGEVQRLAEPEHLAGTTATFQAVAYLGMPVPLLLSLSAPLGPPPVLILILSGLAVVTMIVVLAGDAATTPPRSRGVKP